VHAYGVNIHAVELPNRRIEKKQAGGEQEKKRHSGHACLGEGFAKTGSGIRAFHLFVTLAVFEPGSRLGLFFPACCLLLALAQLLTQHKEHSALCPSVRTSRRS
jgi:hypothetical protein